MLSEEYQWFIKLVQARYQYLNLSFEQAEKIYEFEKIKDAFTTKHYYSPWEEQDFQLTAFDEILSSEQFLDFKKFISDGIHNYEQNVIERDKDRLINIAYVHDQIEFLETHFIPSVIHDHNLLLQGWFISDTTKIDYLKAEYMRFLTDSRTEILTNHFRVHRRLAPNGLKESSLLHQVSRIVPDYIRFKYAMDEPTKAVAQYFANQLRQLPENTKTLLKEKFDKLNEFHTSNFRKHFGEMTGWHVPAPTESELENERRAMSVLLVDSNRYRD